MLQLIVVLIVGVLTLSVVVQLVLRARRTGARAPLAQSAGMHAPISDPSLARTASRENPLLVLHSGHALRCWPRDEAPWTRADGEPERLSWVVEVDGTVERQGPSTGLTSTSAEVTADVREWWDGVQLSAAASRASAVGRATS
jgi:hypothetical protein